MVSSRDSRIIDLWLERQASPHARGCFRRDVARLLIHVPKSLRCIALGDLRGFAQSLSQAGLAPVSRGSHAGGDQEPVRILPAHALCSLQRRRRTFVALL
jgi:hypothetical protein